MRFPSVTSTVYAEILSPGLYILHCWSATQVNTVDGQSSESAETLVGCTLLGFADVAVKIFETWALLAINHATHC